MTISERLTELEDGKNPRLVLKLPSGFVVMAENQYLRGYCLLLAYPMVNQLTDLQDRSRTQYLEDLALVGDAVAAVTECKRVNYAMYGNVDPFLHAHIWPRYEWEIPEHAELPPLSIPEDIRTHEDTVWDPAIHGDLQDQLRMHLLHLVQQRTMHDHDHHHHGHGHGPHRHH